MKRTLFISFFCLLLSAHFASGATAGVLSFELSPVGPNYLFGSTVSFKVLYNGVETTGTCSLATTTPGGLSSEVRNAAGCNFNAYQLLLVGVYNFSITYTDPTNGPSTLSTTATVASAPALKFSFILSQQNPPAGSSLTVSSTFVADLTTMDSAWAATHPTITGNINCSIFVLVEYFPSENLSFRQDQSAQSCDGGSAASRRCPNSHLGWSC